MFYLDLDVHELFKLQDDLGATEQQFRSALSRALRRTAGTIRKEASKGLQDELQLRAAKYVRRRLRNAMFKRPKKNRFGEVSVWFGFNDLPLRAFKGRARNVKGGAEFVSRGVGRHFYKDGFVGKMYNSRTRTIFQRVGEKSRPIQGVTVPVHDRMQIYVEDEIFTRVDEIFMHHFMQDLRGRTKHGAGR